MSNLDEITRRFDSARAAHQAAELALSKAGKRRSYDARKFRQEHTMREKSARSELAICAAQMSRALGTSKNDGKPVKLPPRRALKAEAGK